MASPILLRSFLLFVQINDSEQNLFCTQNHPPPLSYWRCQGAGAHPTRSSKQKAVKAAVNDTNPFMPRVYPADGNGLSVCTPLDYGLLLRRRFDSWPYGRGLQAGVQVTGLVPTVATRNEDLRCKDRRSEPADGVSGTGTRQSRTRRRGTLYHDAGRTQGPVFVEIPVCWRKGGCCEGI